jgi:D-tyrosyl-tRNA(Tyr) deacylase
MRLVIQRTTHAKVLVDNREIANIGIGMLVLVAIATTDTPTEANYFARRLPELRIFPDLNGKMNLNLSQVGGSLLLVPNFTLYADCSRGRRPDFNRGASPDVARPLFHMLLEAFMNNGTPTQAGLFGADMKVHLVNDGPITLVLDSARAV